MNALLTSFPADAMSYLPDNPTRQRLPESYQPILFPRPGVLRAAPRDDVWSKRVFWCTVLFLGASALTLLAWGVFSGVPRTGNTEKPLQAQLPAPKLKGDETGQESWQALPLPPVVAEQKPALASVELPAPPKSDLPGVPMPEPVKVEPPAPMPLKAETPSAPVKFDLPAVATEIAIPKPVPIPQPPVMPPLPAVEIVAPLPDQREPTIFLGRANPGETPMIRTWKTLALYSLLAVAPVAAPAGAGGQDDAAKLQKKLDDLSKLLDTTAKAINSAGERIDAMKADVGKIQKDVGDVKKEVGEVKTAVLAGDVALGKTNTKVEDVEKQLGNLQADVNFLKRELAKQVTAVSPALDRANMDELKKHLVAIEQAILKLRTAEPTTNRIALSPPAPTGRISLVNMYHEEMLFVINQKTHRVAPRSVVHLDAVPAGAVTYEVLSPTWGLRDAKARNLSANETFTLTVQ